MRRERLILPTDGTGFLIHPDPHLPSPRLALAKPRDKRQNLRLAFGWRAVVMPQRLLLWIALFILVTRCLD